MQRDESGILIDLLRSSFSSKRQVQVFSEAQLQEAVKIAEKQGISGLVFEAISKLPKEKIHNSLAYHKAMAGFLKQEQTWNDQWKAACELAELFAKNGLKMYVLKGFAFGQYYENPKVRQSCDVDCFLWTKDEGRGTKDDGGQRDKESKSQRVKEPTANSQQPTAQSPYERGNEVMEKLGVAIDRSFYKNSTFCYKGLMVENHQFCTAIRGSQKRKDFERYLQSIIGIDAKKIEGSEMWSPSPLFNALYLIYHAKTHFLLEGGITLRHVADWAVLMDKGLGTEDEGLRTKCKEFGLWKFACALSQVAKSVFGVEIPFECPADKYAEERLLDDILHGKGGVSQEKSRWHTRMKNIPIIWKSRWKYQLYSEKSFLGSMLEMSCGFLFEPQPRL